MLHSESPFSMTANVTNGEEIPSVFNFITDKSMSHNRPALGLSLEYVHTKIFFLTFMVYNLRIIILSFRIDKAASFLP